MSLPSTRLHHKLYRAHAVDQAMTLLGDEREGAAITRERTGDYHVVTVSGVDETAASELLAELADVALLITVEIDRR